MSYNYLNLKNYIDGETRNQSDSVTPNLRTVINDAIRDEITDFDYRSLQRHTRTFRALWDNVFKYPLPTDMSDEALIDIQKYKYQDTGSYTNYRKVDLRKWFTNKESDTFAFDYDKGLKWLVGNFTSNASKTLHTMESLTDNGTWTATDDATAIVLNATNFISGDYAIQITNTGTSNSIVNSTMSQVDISDSTYGFVWVYLPTITNLTSLTLLYGNDASNYYSATATTPINLTAFVEGWNLVGFDRSGETETGSPDEDTIDYAKITATYSVASTSDIIFDSLFFAEGDGYDLLYNSIYAWRTSGGTWQETSTADSDILNADPEEFKVWARRCTYEVAKRIPMGENDLTRIEKDYLTAKQNYKLKFPTMRKKEKSFY